MNGAKTLLLSVLALNSCNTNTDNRIEYYPSGKIKRVVSKPDNKGYGITYEYYPDGALESRFHWYKGKKHGVTEHFYPNGRREEITEWKAGIADGLYKQFHSNGQLKRQSFLSNGREIGTVIVYNLAKRMTDKIVYNQYGKVIFAAKYRPNGSLAGRTLFPLVSGKKDTVILGKSIPIIIEFGYPLTGSINMVLGRGSTRGIIDDTIGLVKPTENGKFLYYLKPRKIGSDRIWAIFNHVPPEGDSLSADGIFCEFRFFVKAP